MILKVPVNEYPERYSPDCIEAQVLIIDNDDIKFKFHVCNLCECPEDAIIGRDLFDASDFIDALNLGIKLAKLGYDKVEAEWHTVENEDED